MMAAGAQSEDDGEATRCCDEQAHGIPMLPPECAAVLGAPVALVGQLTAQFDHCPAHHGFALAPSRPLRNLGIRLMRPLVRRTPKDQ
jgi:hypothetical protein